MCIYRGHMCIFIPNMKFLSSILWLGGLCTDADDADANADNYARRTNHDYIGSFGRIPNEPKTTHVSKVLDCCSYLRQFTCVSMPCSNIFCAWISTSFRACLMNLRSCSITSRPLRSTPSDK